MSDDARRDLPATGPDGPSGARDEDVALDAAPEAASEAAPGAAPEAARATDAAPATRPRGVQDAVPGAAAARPPGATAPTVSAGAADTAAITLKLYATLQHLLPAGTRRNAAAVRVRADASLNDVIDAWKVPRELAHLVLVNGVFVCDADRDAPGALGEGDVLAIWPPVAGG